MQFLCSKLGRKLRALFASRPAPSANTASGRLSGLPQVAYVGPNTCSKQAASPEASSTSERDPRSVLVSKAESTSEETTDPVTSNVDCEPTSVRPDDGSGIEHPSTPPDMTGVDQGSKDTAEEEALEELPTAQSELDSDANALAIDDEEGDLEGEAIDWTPEQLQEIRETNYRTFCGEDETDYTKGPSRVVLATDGVEDCTALLLTLDLSQAVQKAVKAQRTYKTARHAATEKIAALNRFKHTINAEIRLHKSRLATFESADGEDKSKQLALAEEVSYLELMLDENKLERTALENDLTWRGDKLRAVQSQLSTLLEDSWTNALLLNPEEEKAETPLPEYDLQAEYQAFRKKTQDAYEAPLEEHVSALDTNKDHLRAEMSEEQKGKIDESGRLSNAVWDAWGRFQAAQEAFDKRDDARFEAEHARNAAIERGDEPEDATSEAFDVHWHQHERELTHELIEAETAYDEAQAAVDALENDGQDATHVEDTAESVDDVDDGYSLSSEQDATVHAPVSRIMAWLSTMPGEFALSPFDFEAVSEHEKADEWHAAELDFGDGMSQIIMNEEATKGNPRRAQIDQRQKAQQQMAAEFA